MFLDCYCGFRGPGHETMLGAVLDWNKACDMFAESLAHDPEDPTQMSYP